MRRQYQVSSRDLLLCAGQGLEALFKIEKSVKLGAQHQVKGEKDDGATLGAGDAKSRGSGTRKRIAGWLFFRGRV
jgi:hypothetical protein